MGRLGKAVARDPKLWKRNLFVLPGGLLTFYAVAGLFYVMAYRVPTPACAVSYRFLIAGLCYSAYPFLAALLIVGLTLVTVGLVVFRGKPMELPGYLHSGTPTHFFLALLASFMAVPLVVWMILAYVEASQGITPFITIAFDHPFQTKFLFLLMTLAGVFAFVPFLSLYLAQGWMRRVFLREVEEVAGEEESTPFPGEAGLRAQAPAASPPPEEFVDEALWPDSRDAEAAKPWSPPEGAKAGASPAGAPASGPAQKVAEKAAAAPVIAVADSCRAILATGQECGRPVGPGGRYCLSHACQARTAADAPCRNAAMEGSTRCAAHAAS
jgi:hypothetical protein